MPIFEHSALEMVNQAPDGALDAHNGRVYQTRGPEVFWRNNGGCVTIFLFLSDRRRSLGA